MTEEEIIKRITDQIGQIYFRHTGDTRAVYEFLRQHNVPYRNFLTGFSIANKDIALRLILKYPDHIKLDMP